MCTASIHICLSFGDGRGKSKDSKSEILMITGCQHQLLSYAIGWRYSLEHCAYLVRPKVWSCTECRVVLQTSAVLKFEPDINLNTAV